MASYHFEVKTNSRKSVVTSIRKLDYINREGAYKNISKKTLPEQVIQKENEKVQDKLDYMNREGNFKNPTDSEELQYKESGNMPSWVKDPKEFWQAAELYERSNGTVFRELTFALPNELTLEQQKQMIEKFVLENIPNNAYSYSLHKNPATLQPDIEQPHVHLIFSERLNDGIERTKDKYFSRYNPKNPELGGAKKDRKWAGTYYERKENLNKIREAFANVQNEFLKKYNHSARVDHRTLEVQKKEALAKGDYLKAKELDRPAEKKLGPKVTRIMIKALTDFRNKFNKNNPEKVYTQQVQEDYILENKDGKIYPKVSYSFSVRRIRKLTQQILLEYEQAEKNSKEQQNNNVIELDNNSCLSSEITIEKTQKIMLNIDNKITKINEKMTLINEQKKLIAPQVKTDIDAERIAKNRVLVKELKEIDLYQTLFNKNKNEYNDLYQSLEHKPSIFNIKQRAEYDKQKETLVNMKLDINKMQLEIDNKKNELFEKTNSPEIRNTIEQIKENILYSNKDIRDQFYNLSKEEKALINEITNYRNAKKDIQTQLNILIKETTMPSTQLINVVNKINRATNKLNQSVQDNSGFGQIKLNYDDEEQERQHRNV